MCSSGKALPGRSESKPDQGYRYGFNGKEQDNEVKGAGVQYDYGFRIYDSRIARFMSVDPLTASYPFYTPYQFAGNKPIWAIDLDGLEPEYTTGTPATENMTAQDNLPSVNFDQVSHLQELPTSTPQFVVSDLQNKFDFISTTGNITTAAGSALSLTVSLKEFTVEAINLKKGAAFMFEIPSKKVPSKFSSIYASTQHSGVFGADDVAKLEAAGWKNVTGENFAKSSGIKLFRNAATGLTYAGILIDGYNLKLKIESDATVSEKAISTTMFSLKSGAAYASTKNPYSALLYFILLGMEEGAKGQSKMIKEQGNQIYPNQHMPYEIMPGLGPVYFRKGIKFEE